MHKESTQRKLLWTLVAAAVGLVFILPAAWMFLGSFRPGNEVIEQVTPLGWQTIWPSNWTLTNFIEIFTVLGFGQGLFNSLVVCVFSVVFGILVCTPAAYAFGVLKFPGRDILFGIFVVSFLIPFEAIAIPLVSIFNSAGLSNTYLALILPGIGNGLAIFNMRQYFRGIPGSIREAAVLDGAKEWRILWQLYVPISVPALINSSLLIFLAQWGAYLWPLLVATEPKMQVAAVALSKTFTPDNSNYGQNFAGALLISLIPALIMFSLQRFFSTSEANSGNK